MFWLWCDILQSKQKFIFLSLFGKVVLLAYVNPNFLILLALLLNLFIKKKKNNINFTFNGIECVGFFSRIRLIFNWKFCNFLWWVVIKIAGLCILHKIYSIKKLKPNQDFDVSGNFGPINTMLRHLQLRHIMLNTYVLMESGL